jgi:hypothetical protein
MESPDATEYRLIIKRNNKTKLRLALDASSICSAGICSVNLSHYPEANVLKSDKVYSRQVKTDLARSPIGIFRSDIYSMDFISDTLNSRPWTSGEINQVALARTRVALALQRRSSTPTASQPAIFSRIMLSRSAAQHVLLIRTNSNNGATISFTDPNTSRTWSHTLPNSSLGCVTIKGAENLPLPPIVPLPPYIICYGNVTVDEYTIVHEPGHLFDYNSGNV